MNWNYKFVVTLGALWLAMPADAQVADSVQVVRPAQPVRSATPPVRGAKPAMSVPDDATANAGKVEWSHRTLDFGTFAFGTPIQRILQVKNISTDTLQLLEVKTSCHCAHADWSREPVLPGQSTDIVVSYHPDKPDEFYRVVTIRTNFDLDHWHSVPVVGEAK